MTSEFSGKTVGVVGLARSGVACAQVLTRLGANVRVYDSSPEAALNPVHVGAVRALGIEPCLGDAPIDYAALDYLVTSPGVRKSADVLQGAVAANIPVLGEIEAASRIARAPILAITGTNGKTTTTVLLGEMLRAAGIETYIAGNIAAGDISMPLIQAAFDAEPTAAIVAEISSFQLEWTSTFRPKVAALLNVTPDHADRQTWQEYVQAKWSLFAHQGAGDWAVLPAALSMDARAQKLNVIAFSAQDPFPGPIALPGTHNRENVLAAAAMARAFGVAPEPIAQVAAAFKGVVHRLEYVATQDGVRFVNNSMCTNTAAFERSLEALPEPKVVIAGGVFKGSAGEMAQIAQSVARHTVRALVLIGKSAPALESAVRAAGFDAVTRAQTMAQAVAQARALAQPGDTVLLAPACASFDMFRDFEDRGMQFKHAVSHPIQANEAVLSPPG